MAISIKRWCSAAKELIELADTVTELGENKHAFYDGVKVQKGIDY
jgi:ATP:corrinoid adenosyltransferase